ncbi:hypothetical protein L596_021409 [Steinernema carpocapsae]|uniref:Uncharacterized protein n=1 Tax=Steinernema carpocapsae TaxID=34508 RepID=A0A4V5ZZW6_STECR|nr:hypothetical protein L596_021409 [Steinernema carpocapsae]
MSPPLSAPSELENWICLRRIFRLVFVEAALESARTPLDVLSELSPEDFEADTPVVSRDVSVAPFRNRPSSDVSAAQVRSARWFSAILS